MRDIMQYEGYIGSVHYSNEDEVFHGKLEGIRDLVTYEGTDVESLKQAFHDAVSDYLETCKLFKTIVGEAAASESPRRTILGTLRV